MKKHPLILEKNVGERKCGSDDGPKKQIVSWSWADQPDQTTWPKSSKLVLLGQSEGALDSFSQY